MKRTLKTVLSLMLVLMMLFSIAGCTNGSEQKNTESKPEDTTGNEAAEKNQEETPEYESLVIYTNSGGEGRAEWLTERAAQEGFDIEVVFGGGGDIKSRLIAEKNNPIADVVFGLSILDFESLKEEDMLISYVPEWVNELDGPMYDKEGYYHGIVKQAIVLIYNPDIYTEETAPKDWPELWQKEEYQGKYNIFGLGGGTSRTVLSSIAVRYLDPNGELGISEEGWNEIKQYIKNGYFHSENEDYIQNLIDGTVPMTMLWGSGVIDKQEAYDFTFGVMSPEIGVPYVVEQVGVINGTKKVETAKAFVEWFGSADIQGEWAKEFGSTPANNVAIKQALPEAQKLNEKLAKAQDIDWSVVSENLELWVEKIELEYME